MRRATILDISAVQAAAAVGDGADGGAADLHARRDLALRQLALSEQAIDFQDGCRGKHGLNDEFPDDE
jgi:hypothetical protein